MSTEKLTTEETAIIAELRSFLVAQQNLHDLGSKLVSKLHDHFLTGKGQDNASVLMELEEMLARRRGAHPVGHVPQETGSDFVDMPHREMNPDVQKELARQMDDPVNRSNKSVPPRRPGYRPENPTFREQAMSIIMDPEYQGDGELQASLGNPVKGFAPNTPIFNRNRVECGYVNSESEYECYIAEGLITQEDADTPPEAQKPVDELAGS